MRSDSWTISASRPTRIAGMGRAMAGVQLVAARLGGSERGSCGLHSQANRSGGQRFGCYRLSTEEGGRCRNRAVHMALQVVGCSAVAVVGIRVRSIWFAIQKASE